MVGRTAVLAKGCEVYLGFSLPGPYPAKQAQCGKSATHKTSRGSLVCAFHASVWGSLYDEKTGEPIKAAPVMLICPRPGCGGKLYLDIDRVPACLACGWVEQPVVLLEHPAGRGRGRDKLEGKKEPKQNNLSRISRPG